MCACVCCNAHLLLLNAKFEKAVESLEPEKSLDKETDVATEVWLYGCKGVFHNNSYMHSLFFHQHATVCCEKIVLYCWLVIVICIQLLSDFVISRTPVVIVFA